MPKVSGETVEGIQSVVLALRALEYLARARNFVGVTELAVALDTTKTRIHRHLGTLVQQGYATHAPETGRYHVGTRLITLGRLVAESTDLSLAAQPHMRAVRETLGQSCVLSQFEQDGARIVLAMSGRSPIEIGVKPGSLLPFHNSAQGKVMLAFATPEFQDRILAEPMPATTPNTITAPKALAAELKAIRARGWAIAPNESALGLNALAAPLFDESSAIVGALAIVDLVQFLPAEPRPEQLDAIVQAAAGISTSLGHRARYAAPGGGDR
jgi:DNA-binding IclR family transcriptional regulator